MNPVTNASFFALTDIERRERRKTYTLHEGNGADTAWTATNDADFESGKRVLNGNETGILLTKLP